MPVISERAKELKRRRLRKKKYQKFKDLLSKNPSADQKLRIIEKLRKMTPGAEQLIKDWGLA
ncbi:MAG: DUF6800 family protein [Pirellulales bacterium]